MGNYKYIMKAFACALIFAAATATVIEDKSGCRKSMEDTFKGCDRSALRIVREINARGQNLSNINRAKADLAKANAADDLCRLTARQVRDKCEIQAKTGASTLMIGAALAVSTAYLF